MTQHMRAHMLFDLRTLCRLRNNISNTASRISEMLDTIEKVFLWLVLIQIEWYLLTDIPGNDRDAILLTLSLNDANGLLLQIDVLDTPGYRVLYLRNRSPF